MANGHGGPRANSGGARAGAGRPKSPPVLVDLPTTNDPLAFLLSVMGNPAIDLRLRLDAAKTLMPFQHPKAGEGVKDQAKAAAKKAASGRFSSASPPLRVVT
ncbi:MAG: hypothetical protein KA740_10185 [Rhodoferax sp.]|nr:hypothetical protein [Rhodoferax sp.]